MLVHTTLILQKHWMHVIKYPPLSCTLCDCSIRNYTWLCIKRCLHNNNTNSHIKLQCLLLHYNYIHQLLCHTYLISLIIWKTLIFIWMIMHFCIIPSRSQQFASLMSSLVSSINWMSAVTIIMLKYIIIHNNHKHVMRYSLTWKQSKLY